MQQNHYEAVFILTPVLSEAQMKDTVAKFKEVLTAQGSDVYHQEEWGLKKLAYPINHKTTGFYALLEFKADPKVIKTLETEFRRDERVLRHLTVSLDKNAVEYNARRRGGAFNKKTETSTEA
ncbi:MAG: 30S ribosomal protein S6 [Bernardetiaceae bacterium]|nr:30S ribosomal protein S6 [Bernardetiaceae bacterium]